MNKKYLKDFLKKNDNTIKKESFSFKALILGPLYLLYKNILIEGILFLTIICLTYYYKESLALLITIIINLYLGFYFDKIYQNDVYKKIEEIKMKNPKKSSSELINIYEAQNHSMPYIIVIPTGIILLLIIPKLIISKEIETSVNKLYDLTYTIPKNFHKGKYNTDYYKHYYYIDHDNNCSITIIGSKNKTQEETTQIRELNNNIWFINNNTYQIEKNKILYEVTYRIEKGSHCEQSKEPFLASLNF